jgi:CheY-like chemotaxis protein
VYNFRNRRALLVENNPNNRMLFEFALLMGRVDFESAETIEQINELWQPDTFAFFIINIDREEKDGLALTKFVRENDPDIGILVFSINDEQEEVERAVEAGCDLYIVMPFQLEILLTLAKIIDAATLREAENILVIDDRTRPRWEPRH